MLLFYEGVCVRCSEGTLKLVVKRSLSTCQPRSQCFSLPIYFLQSFWVQYFASNHMSSQAIYPRLLPWHYNDGQYQNNIVHCYSYILRKDRSVSSYERVRTSEPKGLCWYDFWVTPYMVLMTPQLEKIVWNGARTTGNPVYPHGGSSILSNGLGILKGTHALPDLKPEIMLLFVWLCVSSIKTGTRRIIRLDELSFVVRLERRTIARRLKKELNTYTW